MDEYGPQTYGQRWADVYDQWTERLLGEDATRAAVDALYDLAAGGNVLELAVGTGRLALPLSARGLSVHGIDASPEMVAKLREKPGSDAVQTTFGDFADVDVEDSFDLIFVAFNTFFALTTQDRQVECFQNVAARLKPGGVFVVEAFVPDMTRFHGNQTLRVNHVSANALTLDASRHDSVGQTIDSQEVVITAGGIELRPIHIRYAWPSELDVMARVAVLRLDERWSDWSRSPFTGASSGHVSLYRAPA